MWRQLVTNLLTTWLEKVQPQQETPQATAPEEKKQKKPWAALSEEERQEIRESWKYELPDEYDVFCTGLFSPQIHSMSEMVIPGRFYASGNVMCKHNLVVNEACIINGSAKSFNLTVGGILYIGGSAKTDDLILSDEAVICGYTDCETLDTL